MSDKKQVHFLRFTTILLILLITVGSILSHFHIKKVKENARRDINTVNRDHQATKVQLAEYKQKVKETALKSDMIKHPVKNTTPSTDTSIPWVGKSSVRDKLPPLIELSNALAILNPANKGGPVCLPVGEPVELEFYIVNVSDTVIMAASETLDISLRYDFNPKTSPFGKAFGSSSNYDLGPLNEYIQMMPEARFTKRGERYEYNLRDDAFVIIQKEIPALSKEGELQIHIEGRTIQYYLLGESEMREYEWSRDIVIQIINPCGPEDDH